jgi:protein involved in polysaccharide export with SLBB domain
MAPKKVIIFFLLLFICFHSRTAYCQINYTNVKVDQMTENQIRQLMKTGNSIGYDDEQLTQMVAAQGMGSDEIQKLKVRIANIRKKEAIDRSKGRIFSDSTDLAFAAKKGDTTAGNSLENKNSQPKIFGEELFRNSKISFEPNLRMATPKNYIIGPDDELLIDISGNNEANYNLKVSPEGLIRLQYVGGVPVGGLTIEQATAKIKNVLSKTYPDLLNGRTNVAVNLGNIRSIRVTLIGEAVKPGSYTLPSLASVFNALYASGGPNKNGSFRNIQVIRGNKVISTIDVYDFLLRGIQTNVRLQDQDVINIPVYQTRVEISGEIKRPAIYEVLSKESLQDILSFAGGFTSRAYTANIKVFRNTSKERRIIDVEENSVANYKPSNGDQYIVEPILNRFENRVEIAGAIFRPGKFELEQGLTLKGLIKKADGLKEDAFLNNAYIYRINSDNTLSLLPFNVDRIMKGLDNDIVLQREDKITISSIFDLRDEYEVQVQGEVRNPGAFRYAENMNLEAIIQMSGGFKEGATPNRIEIARRVKNSDALSNTAVTAQIFVVNIDADLKLSSNSFHLKPFDIVTVRSSEGYEVQKQVRIQGEVLYPGSYVIQRKNEKVSDLIKRAGGLTALAFPEGASLRRPGPASINTSAESGRNEINKANEDQERLRNLQRIQQQQSTLIDTTQLRQDPAIQGNDMVGIDLKKIIATPYSKYDLLLSEGDIITVPQQLQTVRVSGEVLKPASILYESGKGVLEYINESGSFTYNAKKHAVYIQYSNGSIRSTRSFLFFHLYPKVKPGAEIFVPKRPPRNILGLQGIIGISTAVASLAIVVVALFRK